MTNLNLLFRLRLRGDERRRAREVVAEKLELTKQREVNQSMVLQRPVTKKKKGNSKLSSDLSLRSEKQNLPQASCFHDKIHVFEFNVNNPFYGERERRAHPSSLPLKRENSCEKQSNIQMFKEWSTFAILATRTPKSSPRKSWSSCKAHWKMQLFMTERSIAVICFYLFTHSVAMEGMWECHSPDIWHIMAYQVVCI